jgi:hypothetical protein
MQPETKKVLIGCGVALGVIFVFLILAVVLGIFWIMQKTELGEPAAFVSPETEGLFQVTARPENPAWSDLLTAIEKRNRQKQAEGKPDSGFWFFGLPWNKKESTDGKDKLFPFRVILLSESDKTDTRPFSVIVDISRFYNFFPLTLWIAEKTAPANAKIEKYNGVSIFFGLHSGRSWMGDEGTLCFVKPHFILSTDVELTKTLIDRIKTGRKGQAPVQVEEFFKNLPPGEDAWGYQVNTGRGELKHIFHLLLGGSSTPEPQAELPPEKPAEAAGGTEAAKENGEPIDAVLDSALFATCALKLLSADEGQADLRIRFSNLGASAGKVASVLEERLVKFLQEKKLRPECKTELKEDSVQMNIRFKGVLDFITAM